MSAIVDAIAAAIRDLIVWIAERIKDALKMIYNFFADVFEGFLNTIRAYVRWVIMGFISWYMIWYSVRSPKVGVLKKIVLVLSSPIIGYIAGAVLDSILPPSVTIPRWL